MLFSSRNLYKYLEQHASHLLSGWPRPDARSHWTAMVGNDHPIHCAVALHHHVAADYLSEQDLGSTRADRLGNARHRKGTEAGGDGGQEAFPVDRRPNQVCLQSIGKEAMGQAGRT